MPPFYQAFGVPPVQTSSPEINLPPGGTPKA
jgi:hypothetical protein